MNYDTMAPKLSAQSSALRPSWTLNKKAHGCMSQQALSYEIAYGSPHASKTLVAITEQRKQHNANLPAKAKRTVSSGVHPYSDRPYSNPLADTVATYVAGWLSLHRTQRPAGTKTVGSYVMRD